MTAFLHDLRAALRRLLQRPGFTVLTVMTLALGIGLTTAVFTVVNGVLLEDLPYPEPERLLLVWTGTAEDPSRRGPVSPPVLLDLRASAGSFSTVAAVNSFSTTFVGDDGEPEQIDLGVVSGDVFGLLGAEPMLGRLLELNDDRPTDTRDPDTVGTIVLDHDFWLRRLGGDAGVIGRTIQVGGGRMQVVGVLREDFQLRMPAGSGMSTDFAGWTPLGIDYAAAPRVGAYLRVLARLQEGVSVQQAQAELDHIAARMRGSFQPHADMGLQFRATPMQQDVVAHVRPTLLLLLVSGLLVLLVACANTAGLLLVSFLGRWREFAIRAAVGAARTRLVRQLLVDAMLLAMIGTVLGVLCAGPIVDLLLAIEPGVIPRTGPVTVDGGIWVIASALALCIALVCGIGPALYLTRTTSAGPLGSREPDSPAMRSNRRILVIAQVTAAFALLYGSVTLLDTLMRAGRADLGFRVSDVQSFRVTLPFARYRGPDAWTPFFEEFRQRLDATGEFTAAMVSELPLSGASPEPYVPAELAADTTWGSRNAAHHIVTPGYFGVMGVTLLQGRDFTVADREGTTPVAIVDAVLAEALLRERPGLLLGRRLDATTHSFRDGYALGPRTVEIVGVVGTVSHEHPGVGSPGAIYMPHAQHPLWSMSVVMRGGPGVLESARRALVELDGQLPVVGAGPLADRIRGVLAPTRFLLALTAVFALVTTCLTITGLYALVAETVRQNRKALGVRAAIGASRLALSRHVLAGGLLLALAGVVLGTVLAPFMDKLIGRAVTMSGTVNFTALILTATALLSAALMACYLPAREASRIDPVRALREE